MNKAPSFLAQMLGIWISLLILALLIVNIIPKVVSADPLNPGVYSLGSKPFGLSYDQWIVKWWQWYLNIPGDQNPFKDESGVKCGLMQNGSVWFLVGSEGKVNRTCTIPADKAILIPIINTDCSYAEPPILKTKEELTDCAVEGQRDADIHAYVDDRQILDPMNYRVTTDAFNVTYNVPPIFPLYTNSTKPVNSQAVADGWYLFLEPMSKGQHHIRVTATIVHSTGAPGALIDTSYRITIK